MTQAPLLDEARLTPVTGNSPVYPSFLGYTPDSWLNLMDATGPVHRTAFRGGPAYVIGGRDADLAAWKSPENWIYGPPSSGGDFFAHEMGEMHVTQLDGEAHRRSRKLILPAFGVAAVTRDADVVADVLADGISAWADTDVDLHPALSRLITRALNVSQIKASVPDSLVDQLVTFEEGFIPASSLSDGNREKWYSEAEYQQAKTAAFDYFERIVDERLAGTVRHDSLALVMEKAVPDGLGPLARDELISAVYLLSVAGVGNIANILCAALWALGKHPDWIDRLRQELAGFTPATLKQGVSALPNLRAVISEVERCYLPAPVIPKMSSKPVEFMGYELTGNTHILQLHGLAHFQEERYPEPLLFNPARWFEKGIERGNAFGGGPHLCLGMGVTRFYVPLLLAQMVMRFDWTGETPPLYVAQKPELDYSPSTTRFVSRLTPRRG